ncbi:MAG TPA: SLBB domain-containing protein, partial [Bryobacteraceae bacterium]|nr:SLBB domain-containing protein [Bryobacteraceae bacterium]
MLPIFGSELFREVPSTFAPLDRVAVTGDYAIGPGDELLLRVWGQVSLNTPVAVDRAGAIYIPQVGQVNVAGIQFRQLPDYLRSELGRVFRNFDLSVSMGQLRSVQVLVVGHARRPGTYTVSALSTLVNAVFASGGPSAKGSMRRIQLRRGPELVTELDLYDLLLRGDKSRDARLLNGDVVYMPPAGPQVAVAGSVRNRAIYEIRGEASAEEVLQLAGGLAVTADATRATLERVRDHVAREVLEFALDSAGLRTQVQDGDIIRIRTILPRFQDTVTLRGNVANPGRFRWRPGMRLRDIIPDKEALVTREYWKQRNELVSAVGDSFQPLRPDEKSTPQNRLESEVPEINWSYAVIERQNPRDL